VNRLQPLFYGFITLVSEVLRNYTCSRFQLGLSRPWSKVMSFQIFFIRQKRLTLLILRKNTLVKNESDFFNDLNFENPCILWHNSLVNHNELHHHQRHLKNEKNVSKQQTKNFQPCTLLNAVSAERAVEPSLTCKCLEKWILFVLILFQINSFVPHFNASFFENGKLLFFGFIPAALLNNDWTVR
jgi:hypothetical protein